MAFEKERNELLQQQLEANQRELVGNSLYIHQKNKLLADLKTHVGDLKQRGTSDEPEVFKNIRSSLNEGEYLDEEWDKFKLHFEQVHPRFLKICIRIAYSYQFGTSAMPSGTNITTHEIGIRYRFGNTNDITLL